MKHPFPVWKMLLGAVHVALDFRIIVFISLFFFYSVEF